MSEKEKLTKPIMLPTADEKVRMVTFADGCGNKRHYTPEALKRKTEYDEGYWWSGTTLDENGDIVDIC